MFNYYKIDIIPIILDIFKVTKIVVSGLYDEKIINQILSYSEINNSSIISIDSKDIFNGECYNKNTLEILPNLKDYDAIFLDDDPNWYSVYNELKIIKDTNKNFPLVFICHNVFPHKRRDSYRNPNIIPSEFLNKYSKELVYKDVVMHHNFYHATDENTPKNGVLTAIEDFIGENNQIGMMNIKIVNGITILFPKNSISQIRLGKLSEKIDEYSLEHDDLSDEIVENQLLINHLHKLGISQHTNEVINNFKVEINKKEEIISDFEDKIEIHNNELNYKDSQINSINSELNLKDAQIKNIESQLLNKENEINILNNQLNNINFLINSLKDEVNQKENHLKNKENELNFEINSLKDEINQKENLFKNNNEKLKTKNKELFELKQHYITKLSKLDNKEYCITCYKEEINNNHQEIEYLKNNALRKKLLNPLSYIYLIFKSKPSELLLNFKLYKSLKNSDCFDIGFYLNNNEDLQDSKWIEYFSPELHYICNGFNEKRAFNKKYFNRNSKKELLDYILNCKS